MPIKGLSERRQFPRIAKIHLGVKAKKEINGKEVEYPQPTDYFVCEHQVFQRKYPGKPQAMEIAFPTPDAEQWASQYYRAYTRSRGLVCKGDGEKGRRLVLATHEKKRNPPIAGHDGERATAWVEVTCPGRECNYYVAKQCRELMMLQFLLLPLQPGDPIGIWQLDTSSMQSILNVNSALALLQAIGGNVAMKPLILRLVPREVAPEGRKKTVHVLELEVALSLGEWKERSLLPAPDEEMPEGFFLTEEQERAAVEGEAAMEPVPPQEAAKASAIDRVVEPPSTEPDRVLKPGEVRHLKEWAIEHDWTIAELTWWCNQRFGKQDPAKLTLREAKQIKEEIALNEGGPPEEPLMEPPALTRGRSHLGSEQ